MIKPLTYIKYYDLSFERQTFCYFLREEEGRTYLANDISVYLSQFLNEQQKKKLHTYPAFSLPSEYVRMQRAEHLFQYEPITLIKGNLSLIESMLIDTPEYIHRIADFLDKFSENYLDEDRLFRAIRISIITVDKYLPYPLKKELVNMVILFYADLLETKKVELLLDNLISPYL